MQRRAISRPVSARRDTSSSVLSSAACQDTAAQQLSPRSLLALPGPALYDITTHLQVDDRRSLRLACSAAAALVDSCAARLQLSRADLEKGGAQLQQRFSSVTSLTLQGEGGILGAQPAQLPLWPSVTSLKVMHGCSAHSCHFLAGSPNVRSIHISNFKQSDVASLAAACRQLPHLASLHLGSCEDPDLQALAALPVLTGLNLEVKDMKPGFWDELCSLRSLQHLSLNSNSCSTAPVSVDLRNLTQLTYLWLNLHVTHEDSWDDDQQPLTLQLSQSLKWLWLWQWPVGGLPLLPHLTSLALWSYEYAFMALLARNCPSLELLSVKELYLATASHAAPLAALTALTVSQGAREQAGAQYGKVFPQLRRLSLCSSQTVRGPHPNPTRFEGMTALESLDGGGAYTACKWSGIRVGQGSLLLWEEDFEALAALPALRTLRLKADSTHAQFIGLLTQLSSIVWVGGTPAAHMAE